MNQEAYKEVLVVGGGIAGLAAAIGLRQAGCHVDLVEILPEWPRSGVGIIQPGNALRALESLGVAQACLDAGFAYSGYSYCTADGTLLHASSGNGPAKGLPPYNGIVRGQLLEILQNAANNAGANLRLGSSVVELAQSAEGVDVVFADGRRARYDLVVAAEGIYSPLRDQLFRRQYQPVPTGQGVWRLTMPRPADMTQGIMMVGETSKAGFVPLSADLMYLLLVTRDVPEIHRGGGPLHLELLERLTGFGGMVARIRESVTPTSDIVYRPLEVVRMPPPWFDRRVIFVGDAAHASTPHLGQGAAMAIEDVVVLAQLVQSQIPASDIGAAYMARRFPRASEIQSASIAIGEIELGRRPDLNLLEVLTKAREFAAQPI